MLNRILKSSSFFAKQFIDNNIRTNSGFRRMQWNTVEHILVFCSVHYIKSMSALISGFALLFSLMYGLQTIIRPIAIIYAPNWKIIFDWQTSLLGGQLTIIGIVYPLVVGLVSVIFQKKSARKVVSAAYQSYSGFMFAGLSGLFLSAFILVGILIHMISSNFTYAVICIMTVVWMILNIVLSIWFFVQSLNVLDDTKRERLVLRFLVNDAFMPILFKKVNAFFLKYPMQGKILNQSQFTALSVNEYKFESEYILITKPAKNGHELINIWYKPLIFILKRLDHFSQEENKTIGFSLSSIYEQTKEQRTIPIFKICGLQADKLKIKILKCCFRIGITKDSNITVEWVIKGMTGETYDALNVSDINAFEESLHNMCDSFATIANSFTFTTENCYDNLLFMKDDSQWERSIAEKFYSEISMLFSEAILKMEMTSSFYSLCFRAPLRIYNQRNNITREDVSLGIMYTYYAWETLMKWRQANADRFNMSQHQRYEELIRDFVSLWESWPDSLKFLNNDQNKTLYYSSLQKHLLTTTYILVSAVNSGDPFSAEWALDLLNRWVHEAGIDSNVQEKYLWQSFFVTPSMLSYSTDSKEWQSVLRGHLYNVHAAYHLAFYNALTDVRLCVAAFLIYQTPKENISEVLKVVKILLDASLVEKTNAFENCSDPVKSASEVIDIYLRTCLWGEKNQGTGTGWLSGLMRGLSSSTGEDLISGRVYMGKRINNISALSECYAQICLGLSDSVNTVSKNMNDVLLSGVFDYRMKLESIQKIQTLKQNVSQLSDSPFISADKFNEYHRNLLQTLDKYLSTLEGSQEKEVENANIDQLRLEELSQSITEKLKNFIGQGLPFRLFHKIGFCKDLHHSVTYEASINDQKVNYAEGINSQRIFNDGDYQTEAIIKSIRDNIFSQLLGKKSDINIKCQNLTGLASYMHDSVETDEGNILLVFGHALFSEYQSLCYNNKELSHIGIIDDVDGNTKIISKNGDCRLIFITLFEFPCCSLLVDKDFFYSFYLKLSDNDNAVSARCEIVAEKPMNISLKLNYDAEINFKGAIKIRFEFPGENAVE